jgi:hypothetical protein
MTDAKDIRKALSDEIRRLRALQGRANKRWLLRTPGSFWTAQLFGSIADAATLTEQAGSNEDVKAALDFVRGLE